MSSATNDEQISMVMSIIDVSDRAIIAHALQANNFNAEVVIGEYYDSEENFRQKYGWDESAFSSNREGEDNPPGSNVGPSFVIHPVDDNQVIYGVESSNFYGMGAPSRPPSRANNISPISRLADMTTSEYRTDTPSSRKEEEDQLQQALAASLQSSGMQSPHLPPPLPPPPGRPPPPPQQSGITSSGDTSVYFGPANRPDYDPNEWAMVHYRGELEDPEPSLRKRNPRMPVFLRCGKNNDEEHRIGALLMIFHQIPAVRNALLQSGDPPAYGYGNNNNWWKGEAILPPATEDEDHLGPRRPPWSDELHRLMAFLEATDRSYGTAELLSEARFPATLQSSDVEKDFFQSFLDQQRAMGARGRSEVLTSTVEVVTLDDPTPQGGDHFGLLDLQLGQDTTSNTLYGILDSVFMADPRQVIENESYARMAWITGPSWVLTFRFQGDDGIRSTIKIPETLYIDRYMESNGTKAAELQRDMATVMRAMDRSLQKEESLTRWTNPQTGNTYDRRVLTKAAIRRCQERIQTIKNRAFWRDHEQAPGREEEYYLPEHRGEPSLLPDEKRAVEYYEAKIRHLEEQLGATERVMSSAVLRERLVIQAAISKMGTLLTEPSADEQWNPSHKYTLRGVAKTSNTVFLRPREPLTGNDSIPTGGDLVQAEDQWWKVSYSPKGHVVEHTPVSYEAVMREACGIGDLPILVYASDRAMQEDMIPLSDALRSFVKFDNRHFKQELSQAERLPDSPEKKRSAVLGADSQPKRLQRSSSMDSMATNRASTGDLDSDMQDAPYDDGSAVGPVDNFHAAGASGQQDFVRDLGGAFPPQATESASARLARLPTPPYDSDSDVLMGSAVSPALDPESARLAQVSLQDLQGVSSVRGPEMQERPNSPFLTRLSNGIPTGAAAEPMGPIYDDNDSSIDHRVHSD